jgi:16S rRNA (adenine1518-N6/adenine1519-N6)-dimethyltransferase
MTTRLRERLRAFGIAPKKHLGQNFLHDPQALASIADAAGAEAPPGIVEIGAGPGTLTDHLARLGVPLLALERDPDLVRLLRAHFEDAPHVEVREADVLRFDFAEGPAGKPPAVVGNIPYNISTPILLHLLAHRAHLGPVVLMLQAELATRLRAPVGTRASGSLTVLLALHARVERVLSLPPGAFFPAPKVASEVLRIRFRSAPAVAVDPERFEMVVRAGFGQRRKTLRNALAARFGKAEVDRLQAESSVDLRRRAEALTLDEWAALTRTLTC